MLKNQGGISVMSNTKDIFISYKSDEFNDALYIKNSLEKNGFSCWMAPMDIAGGSSYASQIPKAIENCKVFLLILSERAQNSKWVPKELDQAINSDKLIIPFMIDDCKLNNEFSFYLSNVQIYFAYKKIDETLQMLINHLNTVFPKTETSKTDLAKSEEYENKTPQKQITITKSEIKPIKNKNKKTAPILLSMIAAVILIIISIFIFKTVTTITIGENKYSVYDESITIENIEFTDSDMESFEKFKKLYSLTIKNCTFPSQDISVFSKDTLGSLTLENCNLTNEHISSIDFTKTEKIYILSFMNNEKLNEEILNYLEPVSDELYVLEISNTSVNDFSKSPEFSSTYTLSANNCNIENLDGITNFPELSSLYINNNKIKSLEPLSDCQKIENIYINQNQLTNLKGLENSIKLKIIYADNNNLTSLEGLENATIL